MARNAPLVLAEDPSSVSMSDDVSQIPVTPALGDLMSFTGLSGRLTHRDIITIFK